MTGVQTCALPICFPVTIIEYDVETANQLWLEVGERLEKLGDMDDVNFKVLGEKKLSGCISRASFR